MVSQYKISDPYSFMFKVQDPEETIKDIAKSSMNRLIGDNTIFEIINDNRVGVTEGVNLSMNEIIKTYNLGIDIVQVQIRNAMPPKEKFMKHLKMLILRFKIKINSLMRERKNLIKSFQKSGGEALKVLEEAKGYKESRINNALADTKIFNAILNAYIKDPEITRERIYNETMKEILENKDSIEIIDKNLKTSCPLRR